MKLCPTYEDVDDYLETVALIERLPISTYVGCHWPVKRGSEIASFCQESRGFVSSVQEKIVENLRAPMTIRDLCVTLGPLLGEWPRSVDMELVYVIHAHLRSMLSKHLVSAHTGSDNIMSYKLL